MRTAATILLLSLTAIACTNAQQYNTTEAFPSLRFSSPIDLQHPGDGSNRLFVVEQAGIIKVFENNRETKTAGVFLDIRSRVRSGGELGLLGLAFHPDYESNGYFYVNYTTPSPTRTVIARFSVKPGNPLEADSSTQKIILSFDQPFSNHNGGQVAFGPDGYLYIAVGDGGDGGDPRNYGQSRTTLLGKILRIDVNGGDANRPYAIPADNPYFGSTEFRQEIYAYGLRNPWRFSFDPANGRLWCGDVGQGKWEEIDIIERGKNYGWRIMEGFHCFLPSSGCDTTGLAKPIWEYPHNSEGGQSISGGYVYRGSTLTSLIGNYIYADFVSGRIWALAYDGTPAPSNRLLVDSDLGISSFGVDRDNELYICAFNGRIYKLAMVAGAEENEGSDVAFDLEQNQPNPVATGTVIAYTLDRTAHVALTLHDMMGREIARLVDARQGTGSHEVKLDAAGLSPGSYYYRLAAGGAVATRRLVVVR